jgi:hypothetical protein
MAMKPKVKAKTGAKPKKAVPPPKKVKKTAPKKLLDGLNCEVCGYRVIVDEACGCVEEHILLCCDRPMTKTKVAK